MTGSFLFVKPSDPEGKIGTAYSDDKSPRYPYDHASWEWLLERAIRRTLLPWALMEVRSHDTLSTLEDKYSMHRWGSYGVSNSAGRTPLAYIGVGGSGAFDRKTDSDLSSDDRVIPTEWSSETKVKYGVVDLEEAVANLPFSVEWLHPDWSSSSLDAWDLSAKTIETTTGSCSTGELNEEEWTWKTTVEHTPYKIPNDIPFKCLSHMRTDDDLITVEITNDDDETITAKIAPTPVYAPRTTDGSIVNFHKSQVRDAIEGAAYKAGWALSEFSVPYKYGLDYSPSTSSYEYGRDGKTSDSDIRGYGSIPTLGCLVDVPDMANYIVVKWGDRVDGATDRAWFIRDIGWGDGNKKQTWWHANDFPKGLYSVLSPKLKDQLKDLCPKCQPAIPPAVPAFWEKFPDAGNSPRPGNLPLSIMFPSTWMQHLALACTPLDMSARLDAMMTTVHRVPHLFAKIKKVTTTYESSRQTTTSRYGTTVDTFTVSEVVTVEGTSTEPISVGDGLPSVSGRLSGVKHTYIVPSYVPNYTDYTENSTWEGSFESNSDFLVCLRSTGNTALSTETTTETTTTDSKGSPDTDTRSYGDLPDSYDPDPDDLLFPDWVLPWIESAELFASIESRLGREDGAELNKTVTRYTSAKTDNSTVKRSGGGKGSRTHKARRKIVSLGEMDTSTGRFPALNEAKVLSNVDPDPDVAACVPQYDATYWSSYDYSSKTTEDKNHNITSTETLDETPNIMISRSRSVSYYVVVKWKFDRTDRIESLATGSSLAGLYRKLADAIKALSDKKSELSDAQLALSSARSALLFAKDDLAHAQEQLSDPEGAEPVLLEEAQAALDLANKKLSDAQSEKSFAQSEYESAENDMGSAKSSLQSAQEAYDAAVTAGEGVEEAWSALESAYTAYFESVEQYNKASSRLANAKSDEATAQLAADAAQDYYDTLSNNIEEILQKAVDDAQAAVDEATSRVNEWEQKVSEIEAEIEAAEAAVEAAEDAIEAAKKETNDARGNGT